MATASDQGLNGERGSGSGAGWVAAAAVAIAALIFSLIGLFTPSSSGETGSASPTTAATGGPPQQFEVELGDLYVKPNMLEVEAGRPVVLVVTNSASAAMEHDLMLDGTKGTELLPPGESQTVDIGVVTDGQQAWCTVPGHKAAGMVLTFMVKGAATTDTTVAGGSTSGDAAGATIDPQATPAADWKPFDPALQPAPSGTEHTLTLHATETVVEVAPGVTQEMWTFNDQVPGPILRGKVGDLFTVTLVNDGKMGHSIDFHASRVAWDDEMRTIEPGESLVYQYKAEYAGIYMYHCGTAPALHHIGNGMYGAIIIDPPDLAPVDHEYVLVQSELYLGPEGQPGRSHQDAERRLGRGRLQRLLEPVQVRADPGRGEPAHPCVGARRGPVRELVLSHRRHDLRHRVLRRAVRAASRRIPRRLAGTRPPAGPGRVRRVQPG